MPPEGFSLFELLIVISIMMALILLAVPSQTLFFTRAKNEVLSRQLLSAITQARQEAIAIGVPMALCPSHNHKTCGGAWEDTYIIYSSQKVTHVFQNTKNEGRLQWRGFPKNTTTLQFLPSGFANAQNGTFWYCEKNAENPSWAIAISQSGRARLMYPDAKGEIEDTSVSCV